MTSSGPDRGSGSGGHGIGFSALLEQPGVYRLSAEGSPAAEQPTQVELRVGRGWAAITAWARVDAPAGPEGALASAGLTPPRPTGSTSERAWFGSWTFRTADQRAVAALNILNAARRALCVGEEADLRAADLPAYRGDPRAAITLVLGAVYVVYCFVVDWLVLAAWDVLVPSRAHPSIATWAQVLVPAASVALFAGYVVVVPRVRLRRVVRRRPPTATEVDGNVPGVTIVGLLAPVALMLLLLALGSPG